MWFFLNDVQPELIIISGFLGAGKTTFIKRVIGLPGEHIEIKNNKVYFLENGYFGMSANLKAIEALDKLGDILYE